jgi:hypothetical protein
MAIDLGYLDENELISYLTEMREALCMTRSYHYNVGLAMAMSFELQCYHVADCVTLKYK